MKSPFPPIIKIEPIASTVNDNTVFTPVWGDINKPYKKKCGHEVPGMTCNILIRGPEELTPEEDAEIVQQNNDLCGACFEEWKRKFWIRKTGIIREEYDLRFELKQIRNTTMGILRGFPPSNTISPTTRITPRDLTWIEKRC